MGYKGDFYKFFIVLIISKLRESHLKILIFCNLTHIKRHHPTKKHPRDKAQGCISILIFRYTLNVKISSK